jgi:hypothetical protein
MTTQPPTAMQEALAAARKALTQDDASPFDPVPDGYYARTDVPTQEVSAALAKAGIHLPA